jgi:hypothetical protein
MPNLITGCELARRLNVTPSAISLARKDGRIAYADEQRKLFDADGAVVAWQTHRKRRPRRAQVNGAETPLGEARLRRELADAAKAEIELEQMRGKLAPTDVIERIVAAQLAQISAGLRSAGGSLVPRVRYAGSDAEALAIFQSEIRRLMRVEGLRPSGGGKR